MGNIVLGILSHQENLDALIADWSGMPGIEAFKVDAAWGSGSAAVRVGVMVAASGYMDSVLVMGVEKMIETFMAETIAALATATDADYESNEVFLSLA